jgi:hypothetical protein
MAGVYLTMRWFLRQPQSTQARAGLSVIGLGLVILAAIGRLPWIVGVAGGFLPLLVAVLRPWRQRRDERLHEQDSTGGQSVVETRFLRMTLDHATGEMAGQVLAGRFAGQAVEVLSQEQLLELLNDFVGEDDESAALLRAYLDRSYGTDWQEASRGDTNTEGLFGEMTRSAAHAILGLEEGASKEQIIAAHGRLIQRLHPDRGGSTFLAAKINQARDVLLGV